MPKYFGGGIALLLGLGTWALMMNYMLGQPKVEQFGVAFGNASNGQIELHMVVSMLQSSTDMPTTRTLMDGTIAEQSRDEYVAEHFLIKHSDGSEAMGEGGYPVKWKVTNRSPFIDENKFPIAEWYLIAKLNAGEEYHVDFKPHRDEPVVFRHTFVAPQAEEKMWRIEFVETEL